MLAVFREALSNAARHAQASQVEVSVEAGSDLVLRVADDGTGIPPGIRRRGLANMAERAERLGGTLQVGLPMRMQEPERCRSGGCASAAGSARSAVIERSPSAVTNPAQCG